MAGAAPTEILQYTKNHEKELYAKVADASTRAGHPVSPQLLNPDSRLEEIRDKISGLARVAGGTAEETLGGAGHHTHVVTSKGKLPILIALKRKFRKKSA